MNVAAERVAPAAASRTGLKRGRTWILAGGDLAALFVAYAATYAIADRVGKLPPVSAPAWLLIGLAVVAVPAWIAVFTAYHLYENDSLKISVASFDEVRDIFHAMLAGSLFFLVLSQGLRHLAHQVPARLVDEQVFLLDADGEGRIFQRHDGMVARLGRHGKRPDAVAPGRCDCPRG